MSTANPPTRTAVRIALGMTAALLFTVVILTAALSDLRGYDFITFYTGGLIVRQGNASRLYDLDEQARIERQVMNRGDLLMYLHPPFEAYWFAPLARLSYVKAYFLWGAVNVLLWLVIQHVFRRYAPIPRHPFHYFLLCSLFFPLWVALMRGQTSVLLLLLFSLTFICLKRGQDYRAGVFLGLGLFKFAIVLPFALICLLRSKWKLMAALTITAFVLAALSVIAVGPSAVRAYINLLIESIRDPANPLYGDNFNVWGMPTVGGFFATLLNSRLPTVSVSMMASAVSACLVLFAAWRWRGEDLRPGEGSSGLMFAAALAVSVVTAPHLYLHDLTLLMMAVLLVIGSSQWPENWRERKVLTATVVILYIAPLYLLLLRRQAVYLLAPVLVAFALAAIHLARKAETSTTS
jgi:hypothetical protein